MRCFYCSKRSDRTSVFLHGVRFDHCQCLLFREEEVDLSFRLFVACTAMQLVDGLILHSKLGP